METEEKLNVNGFRFETEELAQEAQNELKNIYQMRKKTNMHNIEEVFALYNKLLEMKVCKTPVGYCYLRELQGYLLKNQNLLSKKVEVIPIEPTRSKILGTMSNRARELEQRRMKTYQKELRLSIIINIFLCIAVAIMLYIATTGNHKNILNYEEQIINQYEHWELELQEREKTVREYEKKYGINQ